MKDEKLNYTDINCKYCKHFNYCIESVMISRLIHFANKFKEKEVLKDKLFGNLASKCMDSHHILDEGDKNE